VTKCDLGVTGDTALRPSKQEERWMTDTAETRWESHNEAGRRHFAQGDYARAEQAFIAAIREASALGADNVRLASSLANLGQLKYRQKDLAQAEALFRRSLAMRERVLGPEHLSLVQSLNNLAAIHYGRGELEQAEPLFRRSLQISETHLGEKHADVAVTLNNLARLCFRRNDYESAAPLLLRLLAIKEEAHGPEHPEVASILTSLAKVRSAQGEHDAAEQLARRVVVIREKIHSPDDPAIAMSLEALADVYANRGKVREAHDLRERALAIRELAFGPDHPSVATARAALEMKRAAAQSPALGDLTGEMPAVSPTPPSSAAARASGPTARQRVSGETTAPRPSGPGAVPPPPGPPEPPPEPIDLLPQAPIVEQLASADDVLPAAAPPPPPPAKGPPEGADPMNDWPRRAAPSTTTPGTPTTRSVSLPWIEPPTSPALRRPTPLHIPGLRMPPLRDTTGGRGVPTAEPVTGSRRARYTPDVARRPETTTGARARRASSAVSAPRERDGEWSPRRSRRSGSKLIVAAIVLAAVGAGAWYAFGRPHDDAAGGEAVTGMSSGATSPSAAASVNAAEGRTVAPSSAAEGAPAAAAVPPGDSAALAPAPTPPDTHAVAPLSAAATPAATPPQARKSRAAADADADLPSAPPLPAPRINLDRVTSAIGEHAAARADSLGRKIEVKPPTFGKPKL
jgi:tetratricopeptide (TPR) repeat protein